MAPDVVVVGGGPAGLAAATDLARAGVGEVVVLEREARAGGIPRHSDHPGFGVRDLHRPLAGPAYAALHVARARAAGARMLEEATVTGWSPEGPLEVTSPRGRETLAPRAVLLATGCRERPRAARLVPGTRPDGVMTTGTLQQLVHLHGASPGRRAVVVGAEHVSFSALATLADAGVEVAGMTTEQPRHESLALFRLGAALRWRVPVWTRTAVTHIDGRPRVEAVELTDLESGGTRRVACDTVVFTADWIPDHELAVLGGVALDPGTRGPAVDTALRTTRLGTFAAGNLVRGAEPADVAALEGRSAAAALAAWLTGPGEWPAAVPVVVRAPLRWVSPNRVPADGVAPPRDRFLLRADGFLHRPSVGVFQRDRVLWTGGLPWLQPGRSANLPAGWLGTVDPAGEPVEVRVLAARRGR